jgi:hypothetical protein
MSQTPVVPESGLSGIRKQSGKRSVGRTVLVLLLVCITLLGLAYLEEDLRGRYAWERCKRQLQAKGATLDWAALKLTPVPDELNFFKAPNMADWFGSSGIEMTNKPAFMGTRAHFERERGNPLAEVRLVTPKMRVTAEEADLVLSYGNSILSLSSFGGTLPESLDSADAIIPLIVMEDVPLPDAIRNLARQANFSCTIDPGLGLDDSNRWVTVSVRWENVTARQALYAVLNNYNLRLVGGANGEAPTIKQKQLNDPKVQIEPSARASMDSLFRSELAQAGQQTPLPSLVGAQGLALLAQPLPQLKPLRVVVRTDESLTGKEMAKFFPVHLLTAWPHGYDCFQFECVSNHCFRAYLSAEVCWPAAEYLRWTDRCLSEFDMIRAALERPYAQLESERREPTGFYLQNFVAARVLTQTLVQRSQCYLLLNQPEAALRELTLVHDFSRVLTRRPVTFVAAMINGAVRGMYVNLVADGLRMKVWQEPQLAVIQQQLKEVCLIPPSVEGFEWERLNLLRALQRGQAVTLIRTNEAALPHPTESATVKRLKDAKLALFGLAPRGWVYQNMVTVASLNQGYLDAVDKSRGVIFARKIDTAADKAQQTLHQYSPGTFMAAAVCPEFSRAWQAVAKNQTRVNQAFLACALERYRLAHGGFPESLDALVPAFAEQILSDVIDKGPTHYQLQANGRFILYSVGWNGLDEHEMVSPGSNGSTELTKGDWVWSPDSGS